MEYIIERIIHTFTPNWLKMLFSGALSVLCFLFGSLYTNALIGVLMLMIIDTIFGMACAYSEGQDITSRKFSRAVIKGIVYFTSISAGYFADLTVPFNVIQASMIGFIGVTEFISILENMGRLGYKTPKKLLNQLKDYQANK